MKSNKCSAKSLFVFLCILMGAANLAYCVIDECHWSIMGPTAVTFDWRGSDDTIYYGTTSGNLTSSQAASAASPTPDTGGSYWECALTGLDTNTLYYYKISSSGTEHTFRTPPLPGSSGFTIVAASDFQESDSGLPHTTNCMDLIASASPRFVLHVGDITGADDYGGETRAHAVYNLMMTKWSQDTAFMPCFGNHDWDSAAQVYWTIGRCAFPNVQDLAGVPYADSSEDWGWFDYGNTRFISYPEGWSGGWSDWNTKANAIFSAAQNNSNIKWIVVWGHRPAYSTGYHSNDGTHDMAPYLNTLADNYSKFKLCFSGHNHLMEISGPQGTHGVIYAGASSPYPCQNYEVARASFTTFRALHPGFAKVTFNDANIVLQYIAADDDTGHADYSEITGTHNPGDVVYTYTINAPDNNAPSPDPMTWASVPADVNSTSVTMTATTASDATGPVQYFFQNTTSGMSSHNNGWQTGTSWTDIGLTASTQYSYQVQARDSVSPTPNVGGWSTTADVTTPVADTAAEIHFSIISNTAVTFDWVGTASHVHYGRNSGDLSSTAAAVDANFLPVSSPWVSANSGPFREAKLTGLSQNTTYYYKIGDDGVQHTFKTPLAPGGSGFIVTCLSDLHYSGADMTAIMSDMAAVNPTVVLIAGDITGAKTTGQANVDIRFNDFMAWSQEAAVMPAWGNHEWDTPAGDDLRNYKGRFDLPNSQTSPGSPAVSCCGEDWSWFDYGNVRFITYPEPWSGAWADWVTNATGIMSAAQANPNIKFIITYGHRPAYDSRTGGDATLQGYLNGLGDQFSKYVLNFCGHSHHYERSYPQHGVIHVIDGAATGGMNTGDCNALYTTCPPPAWSAFRAQRWGFVKLNITTTGIEGSYIAGPFGGGTNDVNTPEGGVVDSFTIGTPGGSDTADQIHWTIKGNTAVTFDWVGTASFVHYGTDSEDLNNIAYAVHPPALPVTTPWTSNAGPFWEAPITSLAADTLYYYRVGDSGTMHTFRTPLPPGSSDFRVCLISDLHRHEPPENPDSVAVFQQLASYEPDFAIITGDLTGANTAGRQPSYPDIRFHDVMAWSQDAAYMPVWGNHDWETPALDDLRNYKGRFDLPNAGTVTSSPIDGAGGYERYEDWYWFDYGNVRFISYPEPYSGSTTWDDWKTQAEPIFSAAQQDPNIDFIVTLGHRASYTSTTGRAPGELSLRAILNYFGDTYTKYNLSINGHDHNYQRYYPQHGVTFITSPTGGAYYRDWDTQPAECAYRVRHFGVVVLDINESAITGVFRCGRQAEQAVERAQELADMNACDVNSVIDSFTINAVPQDYSPPTPNPMTWASVPTTTAWNTITMTATTATDANTVQYFFHNLTVSGHDSGWIDSTTWADTGLNQSTTYSYQVKARDNSSTHNETAYSTVESATTLADPDHDAPAPNPMTWALEPNATGPRSIAMTATTASDPAGVRYYFINVTIPSHVSGWQDSATWTDTGLTPNRTYFYQIKARDKSGNLNETAYSTSAGATTLFGGGSITIYSDSFEYGNYSPDGLPDIWTVVPSTDYVYIGSYPYPGPPPAGSKGLKIKGFPSYAWVEKTISTVGYSGGIHVKYARRTENLGDPYDAGEYFFARWSANGGTTWNEFEQSTEIVWALKEFVCSSAADNNPNFKLKFGVTANGSSEISYLDAIEVFVPGFAADIRTDGVVDMFDLALFASHWRETGCVTPTYCGGADLDKSGTVGLADLDIIAEQWLQGI
jgi:predicted MPP superfamily phosphohydrolase